ncbi:MAG TPA: hypothetical protein VMH78_02825 [Thermoplasmata archaeon]|nr:hypothetical protein [Thermoplasmata archaeon]
MDPTVLLQALLFAMFSTLTALLAAVIGPTYDHLLVPELATGSLYPSLPPFGPASGFLAEAARLSDLVVVGLVDPAIVVVGAGVALLYLARSTFGPRAVQFEAALPKLVVSIVLANLAVPVAGGILSIAGATYATVQGLDGVAWQQWVDLAGVGGVGFSWDNGVLAFVVSFALFSVVLLLAAAVALRDALLAVLLVLLPAFTLLYPIPTFAPIARRAWLWLVEAAFLPCVIVVPLKLAVGAPSVLLLLGFLTIALGAPSLVSLAGSHLTGVGYPSAHSALVGGIQRGLAAGSSATGGLLRSGARIGGAGSTAARVAGRLGEVGGRAGFPATIPLVGAEIVGRGAVHLVRHLGRRIERRAAPMPRFGRSSPPPSGAP